MKMAARRKRDLLSSRRRVQDEGEDDDVLVDVGDDSQSDASELTIDDNPDADGSNLSDTEKPSDQTSEPSKADLNRTEKKGKRRKTTETVPKVDHALAEPSSATPAFEVTADTEAMVNGIQISDAVAGEAPINFEDTAEDNASHVVVPLESASTAREESRAQPNVTQRRTSEQQEYKARREADPSFVPNRGGFFMHDQRASGPNHTGMAGSRGRGRGRGLVANGHQQARIPPLFAQGSTARWDHDLHETVIEPHQTALANRSTAQHHHPSSKGITTRSVSMSKSITIGMVLVRVFLPNMRAPLIDKKMAVKQHTKLPDLRPPLRRDKPVRVSLPEQTVRYLFPSVERSFIFIPRAQRPNQQRNRSRNRGYYTGSRRTSIFGGSNYTPSVAMSRHSSQARDGLASPAGSTYTRPPPGASTGPSRPVVKLPVGSHSQQGMSPSSVAAVSGSGTPFISYPQGSAYPLPSQPTYREHRSSQMTMHQPRPQKQVSVATIESPDQSSFHAPQQQELQPFHHQVPLQYNNSQQPADATYYPQMAQMQVHGYPNGNTPLSNIPEGAINAQPFQPGLVPAPSYYPYAFQQPMYYYPPPAQPGDGQANPYGGSQVGSPVYVQQGQYYIPMMMPMPSAGDDGGGAQQGMYAHESNGAIYYFDSSQLADGGTAVSNGGPPAGPEGYYQAPPASEVFYYGQQ